MSAKPFFARWAFERSQRVGGSHVRYQPHVHFGDGAMRQNCFPAGPV